LDWIAIHMPILHLCIEIVQSTDFKLAKNCHILNEIKAHILGIRSKSKQQ
jgi:hypothetical protein